MGRRDSYLQVRISSTEKAELERRARRAGQDVSTYVRSRVLPATRDRVQALIDRLPRDPDNRRYALAELNDVLAELPPAHLRSAVDELDVTRLTVLLQNYVAAMVEQATHTRGLRAPAWTAEVPPLLEACRLLQANRTVPVRDRHPPAAIRCKGGTPVSSTQDLHAVLLLVAPPGSSALSPQVTRLVCTLMMTAPSGISSTSQRDIKQFDGAR
jgi:hypothetical protein